ncbi:MAG: hypothetical protein AB1765_09220 [Candidatus Hydrogenedentota bacterium]
MSDISLYMRKIQVFYILSLCIKIFIPVYVISYYFFRISLYYINEVRYILFFAISIFFIFGIIYFSKKLHPRVNLMKQTKMLEEEFEVRYSLLRNALSYEKMGTKHYIVDRINYLANETLNQLKKAIIKRFPIIHLFLIICFIHSMGFIEKELYLSKKSSLYEKQIFEKVLAIQKMLFTIREPAYTGGETKLVEDNVLYLKIKEGSILEGEITLNDIADSVIITEKDKNEFCGELHLNKNIINLNSIISEDRHINISGNKNNRTYELTTLDFEVVKDFAPLVEIIEPYTDIEVVKNTEFPLTFLISDDYGIREAWLCYHKVGDNVLYKRKIKITDTKNRIKETIVIDLLELELQGITGDFILFITALDNDKVNGYKSGESEKRRIKIVDVSHKEVVERYEQLIDYLYEVLEMGLMAQGKYISDTSSLLHDINSLLNNLAHLNEFYKDILERAREDPLTFQSTLDKMQSIQSNLDFVSNSMREKMFADNRENPIDDIVNSLERSVLQNEELLKEMNLGDMYKSVEDARLAGDKMREILASDMEKMRKVEEIMREIRRVQNAISEIAKKLQEMTKQLPDDFINSRSVSELDMSDMNKNMEDIHNAFEKGDMDEIIKQAENLLKSLQEKLGQMEEALKEMDKGKGDEETANKMSEQSSELDDIIKDQEYIVKSLDAMDDIYTENLKNYYDRYFSSINQDLQRLKDELKNETDILESLKRLEEEINKKNFDSIKEGLSDLTNNQDTRVQNYASGFLDKIEPDKKTNQKMMSDKSDDVEKLKEMQNDLSDTMLNFYRKITSLAELTPLISEEMLNNSRSAYESMIKAAKEGELYRTDRFLQYARDALFYLSSVAQGIKNIKMPTPMLQSYKQSMYRQIITCYRPLLPGRRGVNGRDPEAYVKIPEPDSYRVKSTQRDRVLKEMQKEIPRGYETDVKEYFKRILE